MPNDSQPVTLRDPFPPALVGKMPRAGISLDYVGHGAVTDRLLQVDPSWNWEPLAYDGEGLPRFDRDDKGNPIGLWIKLTVNGVARLGYGDCPSNQFSPEKVLIGDALRNAAMRFGVALDLWIKGQAEDDESSRSDGPRNRPPIDERDLTPAVLSSTFVEAYLERAHKRGLNDDQIGAIVGGVTARRTEEVRLVFQTEWDALNAATKAAVDARRPAEAPTAPVEPSTPPPAMDTPPAVDEELQAFQAAHHPTIDLEAPDKWVWTCSCGDAGAGTFVEAEQADEDHQKHTAFWWKAIIEEKVSAAKNRRR